MVGFGVVMDFIRYTSRRSVILSWKKIISARKYMMVRGRGHKQTFLLLFENNFFSRFS